MIKLYFAIGLVVAFMFFFEFAAHASDTNEAITMTFSAPVEVPGRVLPAGTYLFQQEDPNVSPNLIQIFNADGTALYATLQTISADSSQVTGETAVTVAEPANGAPAVLLKWFYPGRAIGHELVYSKHQEQAIARARHESFVGKQAMPMALAAGE
jgi:hypothetical protein